MNKCDPFIMKVWLIEILLKKCDMNKCDPFYREDLKRGHIFWCRTFWGGELAVGRVVWVLGMVGVEVSRCVWQGVTFFGVALFGVGGGVVGGGWWGLGLYVYEYMVWKFLLLGSHFFGRTFLCKFSMNILFGRVCCWGVTLSDVALHWVYEFHWISKLIEFMDLRSH